MPPPLNRVLPTGDLVRRAVRDVLDHREALLEVAFGWLVVLVAVDLVLVLLVGSPDGIGTMLVSALASIVALSAVAVVWHRRILRGEPVPGPWPVLDARVLRYLASYLAIGALGSLVFLLGVGLFGMLPGVGVLALPVALMAALLVTARFQLVLPAVASDDPGIGFATSWRLTDGNTVRLFAGLVLAIAPSWLALLVAPLLGAVFSGIGAKLFAQFVVLVVSATGLLLQAPLMAAYLSFVYLVLRERGGPPATT